MRHLVLGCPVDDLGIETLLVQVERSLTTGVQQWYTSINVANWYAYTHQPQVASLINQASLISADGWPIYWASRIFHGLKIPRVPALKFLDVVCKRFSSDHLRVYLLGGRPGVPELAGIRLERQYPGLEVVGCHSGYFSNPTDYEAVLADINASQADILILGMGTPHEQSWLTHYLSRTPLRFGIGIGGGMDIMAGLNTRAPGWMQQIGLEWFYRLIQEPFRLGPRYCTTSLAFLLKCSQEVLRQRTDRKGHRAQNDGPASTKKGA